MSLLARLRAPLRAPLARFSSDLAKAGAVAFSPSDLSPKDAAPGQSPNVPTPWSANQNPKPQAFNNARSEQTVADLQPDSLSAMGLVREEPIVKVHGRVAVCEGEGALGHPKIFINLDRPEARACGYCGTRYQQEHHH